MESIDEVSVPLDEGRYLGFGGIADIWALSSSVLGPYCSIKHDSVPIRFPNPSNVRHCVGGIPVQMNLGSWWYELSFEEDQQLKSYLYSGILEGFKIVDQDSCIEPYWCRNYKSVLVEPCHTFINDLIVQELELGRFVITEVQPDCVHALGVVPKRDGGYRPITDCRRPIGCSINNFMSETHQYFCYNSVDLVASFMDKGVFMSTIDISSAYRSIHIHPLHWRYHGLSWVVEGEPTFLYDTRLSFGLKCAPFVFTQISNFVIRCLYRRGFTKVVNYLDDYILFGDSFESCQLAQKVLISVLVALGFHISWKKCTSPCVVTRYLGVIFDSVNLQLRLPVEKLKSLHKELWYFNDRSRATRHQLQRLCGLVAHAAKLVKGGRTFSRRLIDKLSGLESNKRVRLGVEFQKDIKWWLEFSGCFNGISSPISGSAEHEIWFFSDASLSGFGWWSPCGFWQAGSFDEQLIPSCVQSWNLDESHGHWVYFDTQSFPDRDVNINFLELVPVYLAMELFSAFLQNRHFVCFTDNTQVRTVINKGVSSNSSCMLLLRKIFWVSVKMNSYVTARYIPGIDNVCADKLSRLSRSCGNEKLYYPLCCSTATGAGPRDVQSYRARMGT